MSEKQRVPGPFFHMYLKREVSADDIDDFIEIWHQKPGRKKIFEFLGMTKEEYFLWLCDPESLAEIARARTAGISLAGVVSSVLAGIPTDSSRAKQLRRWLQEQTDSNAAK